MLAVCASKPSIQQVHISSPPSPLHPLFHRPVADRKRALRDCTPPRGLMCRDLLWPDVRRVVSTSSKLRRRGKMAIQGALHPIDFDNPKETYSGCFLLFPYYDLPQSDRSLTAPYPLLGVSARKIFLGERNR
jgi:hypothetical protein